MSGDRLAQIAERAQSAYGSRRRPCSPGDVLALVEIAKAARYIVEAETMDSVHSALPLLHDAMARLDSGATEGDA